MNIDYPDGIKRQNRGGVHAADAYANIIIPERPNPTFTQSFRQINSFYHDFNEIRRFKYRTASYAVSIVENSRNRRAP
jgi:hypothetical protein